MPIARGYKVQQPQVQQPLNQIVITSTMPLGSAPPTIIIPALAGKNYAATTTQDGALANSQMSSVSSMDLNHDGRVDARDMLPSNASSSSSYGNPVLENLPVNSRVPLVGSSTSSLDRNGDGRVDARDFSSASSYHSTSSYASQQSGVLSNDRNMNGIPDNLERGNLVGTGYTQQGLAGGLSNDRNMNGIPDNLERRHNPLDRNGDGRVDLKDLTGRPGYGQQGLAGGLSNNRNMNGIPDNLERTSGFGTTGLSNDRNMNGIPDNLERRNPLDRNGDGRVDLKDLTGRPGYTQQGLVGTGYTQQQGLVGAQAMMGTTGRTGYTKVQPGVVGTTTTTVTSSSANPLDRNGDGRVDLKDLTGRTGYTQQQGLVGTGYTQQGLSGGLSNDRNMNGIPDNLERRHNPLDRNGDGRVDLKDLTGRPGYAQQGLVGSTLPQSSVRTINPLDRNGNGIPDSQERLMNSNDRNMNGIPDNLERRNPLDRNGDGRVDLKDLTGRNSLSSYPTTTSSAPLASQLSQGSSSHSSYFPVDSTTINASQLSGLHPMTAYYLSGQAFERNQTTSLNQPQLQSTLPAGVQTTTTTSDSIIPAKLVKEGAISSLPPTQSRPY